MVRNLTLQNSVRSSMFIVSDRLDMRTPLGVQCARLSPTHFITPIGVSLDAAPFLQTFHHYVVTHRLKTVLHPKEKNERHKTVIHCQLGDPADHLRRHCPAVSRVALEGVHRPT